jgi:hypothetical protein
MSQPQIEENVRDLLDRRERELMQQIQLLQDELAALRNDLTPREVELIEVRRAKAALGITSESAAPDIAGLPRRSENRTQGYGVDRETACRSLVVSIKETPQHSLKIKELLVLAFIEHFQMRGASPADLKIKIQTAYGRDIDPGSIRPNLGRLREDGIVMRSTPPKWVLQPDAATILTPLYFGDDLLGAAKAFAWRDDATEQPASVALIETRKPESTRVLFERLRRRTEDKA